MEENFQGSIDWPGLLEYQEKQMSKDRTYSWCKVLGWAAQICIENENGYSIGYQDCYEKTEPNLNCVRDQLNNWRATIHNHKQNSK